MSTKDVVAFVKTMLDRWPPYRWDETQERAYAEDLQRELSGYLPDVLERARRDMVRKRVKTQTPSVAECIGYCSEAKKWIDAESNKGQLLPPPERNHEWSPERVKLAYELIRTPLGKQAADQGWVLALWNFVRKNGRHPVSEREFAQARADARSLDDAYAMCVRGAEGVAGMMLKACETWGASMLAKRKALAEEVRK